MHVLMLGWEFPPFISGGLGTACHGLTKALDRHGVDVTFVLPKPIDRSQSSHVDLLSPDAANADGAPAPIAANEAGAVADRSEDAESRAARAATTPAMQSLRSTTAVAQPFAHVKFIGVPAGFVNPYQRTAGNLPVGRWVIREGVRRVLREDESLQPGDVETEPVEQSHLSATDGQSADDAGGAMPGPVAGSDYGGDLLETVFRFRAFCLAATRNLKFDVVHAHDWLTYPAGLAVAGATGKPLVVHVHSTEFDRSGIHVNQRVYDIERRGMHGAMRVVAVSQLTKNVIMRRYSVPDAKVAVVYNGVDLEPTQGEHRIAIGSKDKIVLYFGRITYQKGPEYFIQAARRVLEMMDDVKFVVAGSGDQAARMIEMAARLGIGHKVLFTGFLRGKDIQRVFSLADLYVMPSVSEPFGIAPLEAMSHDVPVIISKQSGVSEVVANALKVDFWDINEMANKIVAVLKHPPLASTLRQHGSFEVRRMSWTDAARRCLGVYDDVSRARTN